MEHTSSKLNLFGTQSLKELITTPYKLIVNKHHWDS